MLAGVPWPRGVHANSDGCNIAIFSSVAQAVGICLFDPEGRNEQARYWLTHKTDDVWHGFLPDAQPGLVYGILVAGCQTILLDPYAREIVHTPNGPLARLPRQEFDWEDEVPLRTPLAQTVLYELHVKGFSQTNPAIPSNLRGSYAALAHPYSIAHFKALNISAISLLPVHAHWDEERLRALGLSNYWGYNTLGYFAAEPNLACTPDSARLEFCSMVKTLHAEGIEVILDVVFNHSAESDRAGPTLHFRALDDSAYYLKQADYPSEYANYSGCGNTLNINHPAVLQLVLDSMRYWVTQMHVDGFRFDLAPILGRSAEGFDPRHAFFQAIAQDPILQQVKLIAEPWDIGPRGYQLGQFPAPWLEWNDRFRDTMRGYWITPPGTFVSRGEFAMRFCGSSDIFFANNRQPTASVNFVTAHDGFTLFDAVHFADKRNFANGENNRDGHSHNLSRDCAQHAPQIARALLATTLLAQGTPMLCSGDEIGKSQQGNNNAYCQDNLTSWLDWQAADHDLLSFTQQVLALRAQVPLLRHGHWFSSRSGSTPMLAWRLPNGAPLEAHDWQHGSDNSLLALIDDKLLIACNPMPTSLAVQLPNGLWNIRLDSSLEMANHCAFEGQLALPAHSFLIFSKQTS